MFSTGGKIFSGIKEGILNGLKSVINGLISGINKVIKVPFDGINSALDNIRNINIAGAKPFGGLPTITIPKIPQLWQGGILKKGQMGFLEGKNAEAIVPLHENAKWISAIAKDFIKNINTSTIGNLQSSIRTNKSTAFGRFNNQNITLYAQFDGNIEMDKTKIGRILTPVVAKTIKAGGI